jgi:hypothetical protein
MTEEEITIFLSTNVEPMEVHAGIYYRGAAYLIDGTYLPCVMFGHPRRLVDLSIRRFAETIKDSQNYRGIVTNFVTSRASVQIWNMAHVELSPCAWPMGIIRQIHGETAMS